MVRTSMVVTFIPNKNMETHNARKKMKKRKKERKLFYLNYFQ